MAGIQSHLPDRGVFDPDAIAAMSRAFEETCNKLHVFAGDREGREAIATRIIDLAHDGLIDARALRERVLSEAQATV